jgi:hypothetical protein
MYAYEEGRKREGARRMMGDVCRKKKEGPIRPEGGRSTRRKRSRTPSPHRCREPTMIHRHKERTGQYELREEVAD